MRFVSPLRVPNARRARERVVRCDDLGCAAGCLWLRKARRKAARTGRTQTRATVPQRHAVARLNAPGRGYPRWQSSVVCLGLREFVEQTDAGGEHAGRD